jgi:ribosomal subunit interface protein
LVRRGPAKGPLNDEKHLLHWKSPKDSLWCKKWDDERIKEDHRRKSQAEDIKATTLWSYYSAHLSDLCVSALSVLLFLLLSSSKSTSIELAIAANAAGCYAGDPCAAQQESASPTPPQKQPTGANMKLSISYKHVDSHEAVEAHATRSVEKLTRLLKCYEPDLVQLHGVFSQNPHKEEQSFSLNLSLPTGAIHATGTGENARAACKQAFAELEAQVKKHQSRLRHDHEWKRKQRPRSSVRLAET